MASFALIFRVLKSTSESRLWGSAGNMTTCNIFSFLQLVGIPGSQMYNVSLTIYYLCIVRYNMRERRFRRKIEPYLHIIPALWCLLGAIFVVSTGSFNPFEKGAGGCWIAPYPSDCIDNDEVDCIRGGKANLLSIIFLGIPLFSSMIANVCILVVIWYTVRTQEKKMDRYRLRRVSIRLAGTLAGNGAPGGVLERALAHRSRRRSPTRSRTFLRQALWYIAGLFACYTFSIISK